MLGHAAPQPFMRILGGKLYRTIPIVAHPLTKIQRNRLSHSETTLQFHTILRRVLPNTEVFCAVYEYAEKSRS